LTYIYVYLAGKFDAEYGGGYESKTKPNVCQTIDSDAEVVYFRKEVWMKVSMLVPMVLGEHDLTGECSKHQVVDTLA
jgi:hypothetical protein